MLTFKIVCVGDKDIGKTCLIKRYQDGIFSAHKKMTLGAHFYSNVLDVEFNSNNASVLSNN